VQRITSPALILQRTPWSETSWIVRALCPEHGLVVFAAKGARRPKHPWFGKIEPMRHVEICMSYFEEREFQTLVDLSAIEDFESLQQDPFRQSLALSLAEPWLKIPVIGVLGSSIFELLLGSWRWLDSQKNLSPQKGALLAVRYWAKIAEIEGYEVQTHACCICHHALVAENIGGWRPEQGAFICTNCVEPDSRAKTLWCALCATSAPLLEPWTRAETLMYEYLRSHENQWPEGRARQLWLAYFADYSMR
jgi:DNA repair protein RecO (recombination protein O)